MRVSSSDSYGGQVRILVVEDDVAMAAAIVRALKAAGVMADLAGLGDEALWMAQGAAYDVIVLDIVLPDMDGVDVCRQLRGSGVWTPIIMVTARDAVDDRIRGLDAGADDYLTKPFALGELLARLRALARRDVGERPPVVSVGSLRLDPAARRVWRGDCELELTAREYALLETFMRRPGQVLSHLQLLDAAWDFGYQHRSNVVEVYVRYLRGKVDVPFGVGLDRDSAGRRLPNARGRRRVNRLPILVKLTAAFAAATLLMLAAAALFVYLRLRADLDDRVDANLRARAVAAGAALEHGTDIERVAVEDPEESFAQVLSSKGVLQTVGSTIGAAITPTEVADGLRADLVVERRLPGIDGTARILVVRHESTRRAGRRRGRSVVA